MSYPTASASRAQRQVAYAAGMVRPTWLARFSWMPIRARLTIVFMAMMATVLAGAGVFLYAQFRGTLDAEISAGLQQQTAAVGALVARGHFKAIEVNDNPLTAGCRVGGCLAQIYGADGQLVGSTPQARSTSRIPGPQSTLKRPVEASGSRTTPLFTASSHLSVASEYPSWSGLMRGR